MYSWSLLLVAAVGCNAYAFHQDYSTWMTDSLINRGREPDRFYEEAVFYRGVEYAYNRTQDPKYFSYIVDSIDQILTPNGTFITWERDPEAQKSLDDIRIGNTLLYLYQSEGDGRYKNASDFLKGFLDGHARTPLGGFWHRDDRYTNQMWLDGIYMADNFYAHYVSLFQPSNTTAWDDILLQFSLIESRTRNQTTGLLVHGYDEEKDEVWSDPITGAAPHVWNRALGWYFMALVDVLDYFPESHAGRQELLSYYQQLADAVVEFQDESGGWWLIMDPPYPGMEGNYIESSGTAMFTYGMLKGLRKGYLEDGPYLDSAHRAFDLMADEFAIANGTNCSLNWQGTVEVGSLSSNGSYEVCKAGRLATCRDFIVADMSQYYISVPPQENDFKGAGPFIYASAEIEELERQGSIS